MEKEIKRVQITCKCGTYIEIEDTSSSSINSIMDGFNELHSDCLKSESFPISSGPIKNEEVKENTIKPSIILGEFKAYSQNEVEYDREKIKKDEKILSIRKKLNSMGFDSWIFESFEKIMKSGNIKFKPEESEKCNTEKPKEISYDPEKIYIYGEIENLFILCICDSVYYWVPLFETGYNNLKPNEISYSNIKLAIDVACRKGVTVTGLNGNFELMDYIKNSLRPKEGWQKLDINNIPSDILTGKYEFREGNSDIAADSKLPIIEILEYLLPKSLKNHTFTTAYYYRKVI